MKTKIVPINDIKYNPDNPRTIDGDKLDKLVKSIQDFPKMMEIRPIVVDANNFVLGGNQRLRACHKIGLKEVHIIEADDLSEEQKKEFIIKDNASFGDWDIEILSENWNSNELSEWGIDIIPMFNDTIKSKEIELKEYKKVHILISFPPDRFHEISPMIQEIIKIEDVEHEQTAN